MATIVNGVTIPHNVDSAYANNVNLDKIVANDVVVWQKQKEKYVIQNGVLVPGNYTNCYRHACGHSTANLDWGVGGHSASEEDKPPAEATIYFNTGNYTKAIIKYELITDNPGTNTSLSFGGRDEWLYASNGIFTKEKTISPNTDTMARLLVPSDGSSWYTIRWIDILLKN